ncbi:MAG: trypsin-like serine protease [Planctomycetes bacterium]|nr:trypsin-like serine protease [Planctomycetota bacterium]
MNEPIHLKCAQCGAGLKAPANLAGRTLKCPKCQHPIQVPDAAAGLVLEDDPGAVTPASSLPQPASAAVPAMQVCPHCRAQVPWDASKCRHCGEFVHAGRPGGPAPAAVGGDKMHPAEYVVAVLLAPIGLGIGVIWSIQKLRKARPMLTVSIPMTVLWMAGVLCYIMLFDHGQAGKEESGPVIVQPYPGGGVTVPGDVARPSPSPIAQTPDLAKLQQQPEELQRPMRANVRIDVGGRMVGSGVVVKIEQSVALMLTNLHVVDELYVASRGQQSTGLANLPAVTITYVTGDKEPGKVVWVASEGVDLAVVRAVCPADGVRTATWQEPPSVNQGAAVFAVGNPAGLGWTLTRGTVSALRRHTMGGREIPVIQTDTAINPGNSGGGLYTSDGKLVGINNFIIDPSQAQRVGFAIDLSLLNELSGKPFELSPVPQ